MHPKKNIRRGRLFAAAVSIVFALLMFFATYYEWLAYPEQLAQDMIYKNSEALHNNIKIIGIDEKAIQELGDYNTWSRQVYADLLHILYDGETKPAVVGFDILFFANKDIAGDLAFIEVCEQIGDVVLAAQLNLTQGNPLLTDSTTVYTGCDPLLPFSDLGNVTEHGFVDIILDSDGFVRHSLLQAETTQGTLDSLAHRIAKIYTDKKNTSIPSPVLDAAGSIFINYAAPPGSYECISIADVLSGRVPASIFDDAIVLVGSYAEGMMDSYNVSIDRRTRMYGIEINANIIQTLLSGKYLIHPPIFYVALINGVISGLLFYLTNRKKILTLTIALLGSFGFHALFCYNAYQLGVLWYLIYFVVSLLVIYIINIIWKYLEERRIQEYEMKMLLYSMAEAMTQAIDQRTPYNASHTRKVSAYSVSLAEYVNAQYRKKRTQLHLSKNEIDQLKLAALLHDVGKMGVPKNVLDKPTRLGTFKEDIHIRFEKIALLYQLDMERGDKPQGEVETELATLERAQVFIDIIDAKEWISEDERKDIDLLAEKVYIYPNGKRIVYLTDAELECLRIPKGTLTSDEMEQVHRHASYTDGILEHIRFGNKYSRVRHIAASHHELLNGKGYPKHLKGEEIDLPTRILTIADVFDALTADDRPYKKAKTVEQSMKILGFMAKDGEIDSELYQFAQELWGTPSEQKEN